MLKRTGRLRAVSGPDSLYMGVRRPAEPARALRLHARDEVRGQPAFHVEEQLRPLAPREMHGLVAAFAFTGLRYGRSVLEESSAPALRVALPRGAAVYGPAVETVRAFVPDLRERGRAESRRAPS